MRILLVEDERRIADFLEQALRESAYVVETADDGETGLSRLRSGDFDLCVLDAMLPKLDGFEVLGRARAAGVRCPILMLTARDALSDRVRGLDGGADDYLPKPFELAELLARVRALLRRPSGGAGVLAAGDLNLDPTTRRAERQGRRIELSAREFALLELLMRNKGRVLLKSVILERVWEDPYQRDSNVVEVYVNYLRRKIGPGLIHTIRGAGYVLESRDDEA